MPHGTPSKRAAIWSRVSSTRRAKMRNAIIDRDGSNCFHCGRATRLVGGEPNIPDQMTIEHWPIPKRDLPTNEWLDPSRAVIACLECNQRLDHEAQVAA